MKVYELASRGSTFGLHQTITGAKKRAQKELDSWAVMEDEMTEEEKESTEELTTTKLRWAREQHYHRFAPKNRKIPMGKPVPTAWYSEKGCFTIRERKVGP